MSNDTVWSSPFSEVTEESVLAQTKKNFGPASNVEEVDLFWSVSSADLPFSAGGEEINIQPFILAGQNARAQQQSWRSQDPIIDGSNKVPGDMISTVGGFGVVIDFEDDDLNLIAMLAAAGELQITGNATDVVMGILRTWQRANHALVNGAVRRFQLMGDLCTSVGGSRALQALYGTEDGDAAPTPYYGGEVAARDRGWRRLSPFDIGKDQQLTLRSYYRRLSAWPVPYTLRFVMPALIARRR